MLLLLVRARSAFLCSRPEFAAASAAQTGAQNITRKAGQISRTVSTETPRSNVVDLPKRTHHGLNPFFFLFFYTLLFSVSKLKNVLGILFFLSPCPAHNRFLKRACVSAWRGSRLSTAPRGVADAIESRAQDDATQRLSHSQVPRPRGAM